MMQIECSTKISNSFCGGYRNHITNPPPTASLNIPLPRNDYKHFSPSSSLPIRYWKSRLRNCRRERSHSSSVILARFLGMVSSLGWVRMVRMVGVCLLRAGFGGRWERCEELAWAVSGRWRRVVGARSFLASSNLSSNGFVISSRCLKHIFAVPSKDRLVQIPQLLLIPSHNFPNLTRFLRYRAQPTSIISDFCIFLFVLRRTIQ